MAIEIKDIDGGIGNIIIARGVVTGQEYVDTHKKHLTQDKKKLNNSFIVVIQLFLSALLLFHINCTTSHAQEPAKADPKRPLTHQEVLELAEESINKLEDMAKKAMGDDRTDCPQAPGVVKTLNNHINQLSSVLGDQTTTYSAISENNKSPIRTIADSMFDFYMCSRITLGKRRWEKSFSEQQKKSFLVLYREMIIKRLVEQILPSLDKKPVVKGVSCGIENMVTVRFESSKGKYGIIGFRLFDRNGTWKMIDILLDTVSLSSSNRRQFGRIVTESSQESLLEKLREDLNIDKEKEKKLIESFKWPDKKKKVTTEDLIKQLGFHEDTQAVINYLQPLARTDVPKVNLIATAHIIAYILGNEPGIPSELRRSWIETRNGKPVFRLDRVGGARWGTRIPTTVQKAVRRAVNRIEFNYPIGIHVFNNPFSYDRKSIKLPDNYFLRLNSKIPSGAGSLSGEWVLDAFEGLFYVSSIYRGKSFSLEKHKNTLKSHKILVATYNDNRPGGPVSYYFFWYRKMPSNWKSILSDLPEGQGMENIGPPLNFAPDYIQDAKIMVQKYKSGEPVPKQTFKKRSVKEKVSTNKKIEIDNKPAKLIPIHKPVNEDFPDQLALSPLVNDFLLARYYPELLSQRMLEAMLSSRWSYEQSRKNPLGGRFFNRDVPKPTYKNIQDLTQQFRQWTLDRAKALPDELTLEIPLRYGQLITIVDTKCLQTHISNSSAMYKYQAAVQKIEREKKQCESQNKRLQQEFNRCELLRDDLEQTKKKLADAEADNCSQTKGEDIQEKEFDDGPCDIPANLPLADLQNEMMNCLNKTCGAPSATADIQAYQECVKAISAQFQNEINRRMGKTTRNNSVKQKNPCRILKRQIRDIKQRLSQNQCDSKPQPPEVIDCDSLCMVEQPDFMDIERIDLAPMHDCTQGASAYNRRTRESADLLPNNQPFRDMHYSFQLLLDNLSLPYKLPAGNKKGEWTTVKAMIKVSVKAADRSLNRRGQLGLKVEVKGFYLRD